MGLMLAVGCDGGGAPPSGSDTDAGSGTQTGSGTAAGSSGAGGSSSSSTGQGESSSTSGEASDGSTSATPDPGADGAPCAGDDACQSGHCFEAGILAGYCGPCGSDADCDAGCHPPHPFTRPVTPPTCEDDGGAGAACQDAEVCDGGQACALIFDLPGIFEVRGCSGCEANEDCLEGETCSPTYDLAGLGGERSCVAPTTLADGEHCDPSVDLGVCTGFCRSVDYEGLATLGVCSECQGAADCAKGETCEAASVEGDTLVPASCVVPKPKK